MGEPSWQSVDEYLCSKLLSTDPVLDAALASSNEAGLPPIAVAPNQGKLLQLLVLSIGATSVLEIGTLGGYSTTWMARALPDSGRLVTLEFEPKHAAVARANLERAGLAERVEIRVGRALDSLAQLAEEKAGPFDFVFIDADKENTASYFDRSIELARPGSLIFVDNLVRNGAVADSSSTDAQVLGMRAFLDAAAEDPRVEVTAVQTVGSKGYDGFALARVTSR
jgi:predicted O-methyltransferase YrrM